MTGTREKGGEKKRVGVRADSRQRGGHVPQISHPRFYPVLPCWCRYEDGAWDAASGNHNLLQAKLVGSALESVLTADHRSVVFKHHVMTYGCVMDGPQVCSGSLRDALRRI